MQIGIFLYMAYYSAKKAGNRTLNDAVFYKYFRFDEFSFHKTLHGDHTDGIDFHHIRYIKKGKARFVLEDQVLEFEEKEMFYIPKGCKYHSYWIASDYYRYDSIGFLYFPTSATNGFKPQKIKYDDAIWNAFLPLSRDKTVNAASVGALYHLLGLLEPVLEVAPSSKDVAAYEQLLMLMKANPHLTIPEYAARCQVSESLLYHYIKQASGKTPNRLRQEVLCEKAAQLLLTTGDTVEDICDKLGFSSAAYFRKVFQSVYHTSPSHMRKSANMI